MAATRTAQVVWEGSLDEGGGTIESVGSGAVSGLDVTWASRTEEETQGKTSPEELIAAAHAGCFSMAFSKGLADAGFTVTSVETTAKVHLDKTDAGMTVTRIELDSVGDVPGIDEGTFQKIAEGAKENCPISRLLSPGAEISLTAKLA